MILYDKQGNAFDFAPEEVEAMLASGAYFRNAGITNAPAHELPLQKHVMPAGNSKMVTIYEKATGKALKRRPVDANELLATGKYTDTPKGRSTPITIPEPPKIANPDVPLPVLTEENSKQEITETMQKYGVQFRANMDKETLLSIWRNYLLEQGQK